MVLQFGPDPMTALMRRQKVFFVLALCLCGISLYLRQWGSSQRAFVSSESSSGTHSFNLAPGELPGYTGWARPSSTVAHEFFVNDFSTTLQAGDSWSAILHCKRECPSAWFYVRAYGPSILAGSVEQQTSGDYRAYVSLYDPGSYTIEVIVTFSRPPRIHSFPNNGDYAYEGYSVPGFPKIVQVDGSPEPQDSLSPCSVAQLTSPAQGRWRVTNMNRITTGQQPYEEQPLYAYQYSYSSLGFQASWQRTDCGIVRESVCQDNELLLIGDSTMRLQKDFLEQFMSVTYVELYGGTLQSLRMTGPNATAIRAAATNKPFIIWNTGLHDIHRLCGKEWQDNRKEYLTEQELQLSCLELYRKALTELWNLIKVIPAKKVAFSLTQASWPKYGNFGVQWDPVAIQKLPLDASFVHRFNTEAIELLAEFGATVLHDGSYNMTYSRPDHRQVTRKADIGNKLSHAGKEVIEELGWVWNHWMAQHCS